MKIYKVSLAMMEIRIILLQWFWATHVVQRHDVLNVETISCETSSYQKYSGVGDKWVRNHYPLPFTELVDPFLTC